MGRASLVPRPLRGIAREGYYRLSALAYRGSERHCPCCDGNFREFLPYGVPQRTNALCPRCGSRERHRLLWTFLERFTNIQTSKLSMLHFAPEYSMERRFRALDDLKYVTGDLDSPWAEKRVDITAIPYPDRSFDVILCSPRL